MSEEQVEPESGPRLVPMVTEGAEGRLRAIIESQPAALLELSADGRVLAMNARAHTLFRVKDPEAVLGEMFTDLLPEVARDRFEAFVGRVSAGRRESFECRLTRDDGEEYVVSSDAVPFTRAPDAAAAVLLVASDVSRTRTLERRLRAAERDQVDLKARHAEECTRLESHVKAADEQLRQMTERQTQQAERVQQALTRANQELQELQALRKNRDRLEAALESVGHGDLIRGEPGRD